MIVDAVVHEPYGAHPSYVQGYYDRDNAFYMQWDEISGDAEATQAWLDEWVYGIEDRSAYIEKRGPDLWNALEPGEAWSGEVNYGGYR
jgi:glutaconate CoA-transferase subunit A